MNKVKEFGVVAGLVGGIVGIAYIVPVWVWLPYSVGMGAVLWKISK